MKHITAVITVLAATAAMLYGQDAGKPADAPTDDHKPRMQGRMRDRRPAGDENRSGEEAQMQPGGSDRHFGAEGARGGHQRGDMMERLLNNPEIQEKLGLNEKDVAKIQNELQDIQEEMIDLKAQMEKVGLRQARSMTDKEIDEDKLMDQVEEAGKLRTKMAKLQIKKMILFRKHIDSEKLEKIRSELHERIRDRIGENGRDGEGPGMERSNDRGEADRDHPKFGGERRKKFEEMRRKRLQQKEDGENKDVPEAI